mmetsp:Transcript_26654/g.57372  ORF Transcript_26654/g.57372 Transcript_26654/m.57372 type:complete len:103 (-) Transcript_26654:416-724(-)
MNDSLYYRAYRWNVLCMYCIEDETTEDDQNATDAVLFIMEDAVERKTTKDCSNGRSYYCYTPFAKACIVNTKEVWNSRRVVLQVNSWPFEQRIEVIPSTHRQ